MKWSPNLRLWLSYPKSIRHVGDYALQQQVSRAIAIAARPVPINDTTAADVGESQTRQQQ